ncbi:uncharacterized protein A4U43_UnF6990 [Asparagus officinalis]|uniref:Uncharacterized protein n=1 Tax=Asparagus officinalis TaxID=4686 RepID=A0A1R3L6B4_ASPOF|nr:uncharacterized protein A4U43_UnF6990 [Asparagus officinalis]
MVEAVAGSWDGGAGGGKPKKFKRIRSKYRSEPHNAYGQRAIFIWLRSLRRTVPLYSTLAIYFLVCHIAREPILPTNILKWASEGKLPFLVAFTEMDRRLEKPSSPFPLSSRALFRPILVIGAEQLEATAASIAQAVGLRLPSVKFYAIAHRYLKELSLPVEKILPHACRIY